MDASRKISAAGVALSLLAAILAVTALFSTRVVDIHLHDTYYVLTVGMMQMPFAILFGTEALLYHLFRRRKQIGWIKATHVLSCWLFVLFIFWLLFDISSSSVSEAPRRYYDYSPGLFRTIKEAGITGISVLIFAIGQLLFFLHIVISLLKRR